MFGYVRICKDELKVREFNLFKAHYCGLCKTLKKEYGFAARMGLSYDITFLAVLLASVSDEPPQVEPERCIANPFVKKPIAVTTPYFSYTASVNVILTYLKLSDDVHDEHSIKACFFSCLLMMAKRKAKKRYPELYQEIRAHIDKLTELEKNKCEDVDRLAHEFGSIMQCVFSAKLVEQPEVRRILSHMGYQLGRFIYILDAYEDMEQDRIKKRFNPFLAGDIYPEKEFLRTALTLTLSEVSKSYQLLNVKRNQAILDNIIYLGLCEVLDNTLNAGPKSAAQKGVQKNERSL